MPTFEIVCLANSRKRQGRCVAGLRLDGKGWLRPVGSNAEGVLYSHHYTLPDNTEPQLGDVLRVHCSRPRPQPHHPEDWVVMSLPWERVTGAAENNRRDWLYGYLSSGPQLLGSAGDRIAQTQVQAHPVAHSLSLVAPQTLQWQITVNKEGERRNRVAFTLDGAHYNLALTDPVWEPRLLHLKPGLHNREAAQIDDKAEVWLTVSLSEPFAPNEQDESYCYKLVAGVLVLTAEAELAQGKSIIARGSKPTAISRRQKANKPLPAYASVPDLRGYPDPFADDLPAIAVSGGSRAVSPPVTAAAMLPPASPPNLKATGAGNNTNVEAEAVPALPGNAPTKERNPKRQNRSRQNNPNRSADSDAPPTTYGRTNGKWDTPQDKLLWQKQMARSRHTNAPVSLHWSEDEDALLLRLAEDGETPEAVAEQVGRTLEDVYNRMEKIEIRSG